ncbi:hypothetical protein GLOIN_2v1823265 [Rhizophagus clarus]|uniref:Uncharacterized protein n=1 Tax=Rhizophagus clarus TaxID=94130 RepID=A0A8H3M1P2_9GLOM|nr:hypothetical protein GLOIN_2v1823265 [Rhizophagus clarus]
MMDTDYLELIIKARDNKFLISTFQTSGANELKIKIKKHADTSKFDLYKNNIYPKNLMKTNKSLASSPALPASIIKKISTRTISNVIKDFDTEGLIEYLKRKDLKLKETHFKILQKKEIAGFDFLELTEEKLHNINFTLGLATRFTKFIEGLSQKLRNYSSFKTFDDLKEMLRRNKVNGEDITNIKQFTSVFEKISDDDKAFKHCMEYIILKLSNVKTMTDVNEVTYCEFISAILHASIAIAKKLTSQDIQYL